MRLRATLALASCLCVPALALAQEQPKPAAGTQQPPAQVYGKLLSMLEKEFVDAAEAMPEDKFAFAPPASLGEFKGARTFADQLKHVTEANGYFFHDPAKPMVDNRADIEKLKTKAEIIAALKQSFADAHASVDAITPENAFVTTAAGGTRAGMAAFGIAHFMDHYGQLALYLRMNGIVPPASRGGGM